MKTPSARAARRRITVRALLALTAALLALGYSPMARAQNHKNASGESFFIISSVDVQNSQLLLKRPSEVTLLMKVTARTKYFDEKGKAIHLSDLRAGDTVWLVQAPGNQQPTAERVRKGPMSVADLHRIYLDYPEIK